MVADLIITAILFALGGVNPFKILAAVVPAVFAIVCFTVGLLCVIKLFNRVSKD